MYRKFIRFRPISRDLEIIFIDTFQVMIESLGFLAGSILIAHITEEKTDCVGKKLTCRTPLKDVLHHSFCNISEYEKYIDLIPIIPGAIVLWISQYKNNNLDICQVVRTGSLVLLLRALTTRVTILPSPICDKTHPKALGGCNSCIFSGHAAFMLIFSYYIYKCFPQMLKWLLIYAILGSVLIITTRSHYTIDVLVSWLAVYTILNMQSHYSL